MWILKWNWQFIIDISSRTKMILTALYFIRTIITVHMIITEPSVGDTRSINLTSEMVIGTSRLGLCNKCVIISCMYYWTRFLLQSCSHSSRPSEHSGSPSHCQMTGIQLPSVHLKSPGVQVVLTWQSSSSVPSEQSSSPSQTQDWGTQAPLEHWSSEILHSLILPLVGSAGSSNSTE